MTYTHMVKLPIGGAYFRDPQKYNYIFPYKLLVFVVIPKHTFFRILRQTMGQICLVAVQVLVFCWGLWPSADMME